MNPLDRLAEYLGRVERRLRMLALTRGAAITAAAALVFTVLAVLLANHFAFSDPSVLWARVLLFLALALALGLGLLIPVLRLNRRWAAREAERKIPELEERLLTFAERARQNPNDPFLPLLAADTLSLTEHAEPERVAGRSWILSFASAAVAALLVLIWLGTSGPGFLGYGTSLLWGGLPKGDLKPYYDVVVTPGNRTLRRRSDQLITARLIGFQTERVRLFAKYQSASKWEQTDMLPQSRGAAYEFLLAGVPESMDYYIEAGGVRSKNYHLNAIDLPSVKKLRVTYHFPQWTGQKDEVEDPGGDLRAVEGTLAEVAIQTDKPLANGTILLDDGTKIGLRSSGDGWLKANVPIQKDGMYHVASVEQGEDVRLTEDYFIEARGDSPPVVSLLRPGKDARVSPVEEVTIAVQGKDDFGLRSLSLHYSVNGAPEKEVQLLKGKGQTAADASTVLYLEDYKLVPGDVISLYATAKDARSSASTDMYFIQAEPFEREYTQSQQQGGGGGGQEDPGGEISQRQKEIIAATWNQIRDTSGDKAAAAENAAFLAGVQSKLRDQAMSLARRMQSRQLSGASQAFRSFAEDMQKAVQAMGPAADHLKGSRWQPALAPEQQALQYLLRAEATFREIQVAFGSRGGGGGGASGAGRDLQGLFDLELDTEKNQYETGQSASSDQRQKQIDEALQKLEQLARRQQELAEQQRNQSLTSQQRWEQEMLRREAEQLRRQMDQLSRGSSQQGQQQQASQQGQQGQQSGQQGQQGQQSGQQAQQGQQSGQQGQQGQQSGQQGQQGRQQGGRMATGLGGAQPQQLRQALDRLEQALQDMRQAASSQAAGTPQSEAQARRAAERLKEAREMLSGLQQQQNGQQMDEVTRRADQLAEQQRDFNNRLRKAFGNLNSMEDLRGGGEGSRGMNRQQAEQMSQEQQQMSSELQKLESEMQKATRDLAGSNREAARKLREALADLQQNELSARMRLSSDFIRRGLGAYAALRQGTITQSLNDLKDRLHEIQGQMGQQQGGQQSGDDGQKALRQALAQAERLRQQMERLAKSGQPGQKGQKGQGNQSGQPGQSGQPNQPGQSGMDGQNGGGPLVGGSPGSAPPYGRGTLGRRDLPNGPMPLGGGPASAEQTYRDSLNGLSRLEQAVRGEPDLSRDVQELMRDMRGIDPRQLGTDPLLAERINSQVLTAMEQVELKLRRLVDDTQSGVHSGTRQPVPPAYADAVAEYFRRLSKEK